jgi:hypothetical protein
MINNSFCYVICSSNEQIIVEGCNSPSTQSKTDNLVDEFDVLNSCKEGI